MAISNIDQIFQLFKYIVVIPLIMGNRRILTSSDRDSLCNRGHHNVEENDKLVVIVCSNSQASNLSQATEGDVTELGYIQELSIVKSNKLAFCCCNNRLLIGQAPTLSLSV
jgi:hypothetical protein